MPSGSIAAGGGVSEKTKTSPYRRTRRCGWWRMNEAVINRVTHPGRPALSWLSESRHALLSPLFEASAGLLSVRSRQQSEFCCLLFPWEVTKESQGFLAYPSMSSVLFFCLCGRMVCGYCPHKATVLSPLPQQKLLC